MNLGRWRVSLGGMNTDATRSDGLVGFFVLACALTWVLALPTSLAWLEQRAPSPLAVTGAGLSAFGPLFAVLFIAGRKRQLGAVFGRWRTHVGWVVLALALPIALRTLAIALSAALGETPSRWFYPPSTPEAMAALVVFPLGEEFGWRGYAYPRLFGRFGAVGASLVLGLVWGVWHLGYSIAPTGEVDLFRFAFGVVELPLYSVILTWIFERGGRSMAIAIAFHAAAHIDHIELAPTAELCLHLSHLLVVAVAAGFAARALRKHPPSPITT